VDDQVWPPPAESTTSWPRRFAARINGTIGSS
jgi:hypothetical protein